MSMSILIRTALVATLALLPAATAMAQSGAPTKFTGLVNDYSDTANAAGAWHITGDWAAKLESAGGRGSAVISLAMARTGTGGSPHTHHVVINDAVVTQLASGYSISGPATITGNGTVAGFSGSVVTVEILWGAAGFASNVRVTFDGAAAGHFGADPIDGVVSLRP